MQCKKCTLTVPQNLKFVIMKNFCPQCGSKLFSEKEMNHISKMQSRILSQHFAANMPESEVFDIAIFIFNEFSNGYGRVLLDEELSKIKATPALIAQTEPADLKDTELEKENIRSQVRKEFAAKVPLEQDGGTDDDAFSDYEDEDSYDEDESSLGGEDIDDKAARLKEIYKNNKNKVKNTPIRRLDS